VAVLESATADQIHDSRLLALEQLVQVAHGDVVGPADMPTLLIDMHLLVVTGGRERTEEEFRGLLEKAGLTMTSVSKALAPYDYHVIEAAPSQDVY